MAVSWNSVFLETIYQILGWFAFCVWSFSFYPQVLLNYRRKSVVGLNLDFLVFNLTKHSSYLIYNVSLFFSPVVQRQYHKKYGYNEMIPVAPNDVAFSVHAVLLTAFTIYQVLIYERGTQKVSKTCIGITVAVWSYAAISLIIAWPDGSWLWLVSCFNLIQVVMTAIKYIPQAWMNFTRKSTEGWSIGNILLDLSGGIANFMQMGVQSIDQNSLKNYYGNIGKLLLSLVKEGFFKCIDRMYEPETAAKVRIEWTKFATLRGYRQAAKADIKTMAQEDPILWWSAYGPKSTTTTLAIRLLSQVSSSSASERNWSTYSFIHSLKRNRLTSQRAEKLVAVHSVLRINDRTTKVYKESPASRWDVEPEEPSQIDEEDALDPTTGLVGVPFSALDLGETDSSSGDEFQPLGDDH